MTVSWLGRQITNALSVLKLPRRVTICNVICQKIHKTFFGFMSKGKIQIPSYPTREQKRSTRFHK